MKKQPIPVLLFIFRNALQPIMKTTLRLTAAAFWLAFFTLSVHGEDYTYITNNGTITITGYTGSGGAVVIPSEINGLPVTDIGASAFNSCPSLTSVTIGNNVTNIGESAFGYSANLTSVTIPDSMISIGVFAFSSCTSLTNVILGDSVTTIGMMAFSGCDRLTCITVPSSTTNIGEAPFWGCLRLTAIYVEPQNTNYSGLDGVLFNKNRTKLITYPAGKTGVYAVPNTVSTIGYAAFVFVTVTNLAIPKSVSHIEGLAFTYSSLTAACFQGDCPTLDPGALTCADHLMLYYLPGTAGWSPIIGERTALPWHLPHPVILDFGPGFGVVTNQFGFRISWATNTSIVVEASTTLADPVWSPVSTNTLIEGWSYFRDAEWTNYPARFYRLLSQ